MAGVSEIRAGMQPGAEHQRFMEAALEQAEIALAAGEFPVGCVLVGDGRVVAAAARLNSSGPAANELDHAEIVALRGYLAREERGTAAGLTLYSTMEPCLMCYATLLLSGIRTIVYGYEDVMGGGCGLDLTILPPLYAELSVRVHAGVCRDRCLGLFQRFFSNPDHRYWQDSLLARYTLEQPRTPSPMAP